MTKFLLFIINRYEPMCAVQRQHVIAKMCDIYIKKKTLYAI